MNWTSGLFCFNLHEADIIFFRGFLIMPPQISTNEWFKVKFEIVVVSEVFASL